MAIESFAVFEVIFFFAIWCFFMMLRLSRIRTKTVTHGTKIFEHHPATERMVVDWFLNTVSLAK